MKHKKLNKKIIFLIAAGILAAIFAISCSESRTKNEKVLNHKNKKELHVPALAAKDDKNNLIKNKFNVDQKKSNKIILIGIDGADKNEIDKLISLGELPNISRLIKNGAYGNLQSLKPLLSPLIWTSIATGKVPLKHGVTDFLAVDKKTEKEIPVSSNLRKVKALWNIFSENDKTAGIIGWLVTWPAEKINGYIISDHITYLDYNPHKNNLQHEKNITYPENLINKINPYIVSSNSISFDLINKFLSIDKKTFINEKQNKKSVLNDALSVISSTETINNIGSFLYKNQSVAGEKVDLFCIYFKGIDSFSHIFASNNYFENDAAFTKKPIAKFYTYQDSLIGNILDLADESTTVIIVSDHGFKLSRTFSNNSSRIGKGNAVDWHRDNGIIVMSGNNIKSGEKISGANVLDIAPTILYLSGLPAAKDMDGKILTSIIESSFLEKNHIKKIDSYENSKKKNAPDIPIASSEDESIKNELETLGYLNTGTANSYNNIGNIYMNEGKYKLAAKSFQKAIELQPDVAAFYDNLGSAYNAMKLFDESISAHKKSISLNPNSAKAYNNLGKAYSDSKQYQLAIQNYEKAISIDQNSALAYNNIGEVYYKMGKINRAEKFINNSIEKNYDYSLAHYNLAVILGEKGEHLKAINEFKKVLEIDPSFNLKSNIYNGIGVAYFNLKEYQNALKNFKKAEKINPEFPEIHMRLGIVYISLNMKKEGINELKKELKISPDNKNLQKLINNLENNESEKRN